MGGSPPQIVLVTGATGAVGPSVVAALLADGYRVRTLSLHRPPPDMWPEEVESHAGDVTDPLAVQSAVQGVESVIHLAALLHIVDPGPDLRKRYEQINVAGAANVVNAAVRAGVRRVVHFSTIAVYGPSQGRVLMEDLLPCPDTFYAKTKLASERVMLAAKRSDGEPLSTVLRFGAIYGSRIKGNYSRLLKALNRGWFVPLGRGRNRRTLIYDKDVARASLLALEHPDAAGKIFNVSDGRMHALRDIVSAICQALGRKPPALSMPVGLVRYAAGMVEDTARLLRISPPIVRATIDKYTEDIAVDSGRIQRELCFAPRYDLVAGWRDTVREMRRLGDL